MFGGLSYTYEREDLSCSCIIIGLGVLGELVDNGVAKANNDYVVGYMYIAYMAYILFFF